MAPTARAARKPAPVIIDVRTPEEFAERRLEDAVLIPHDEIGARIEAVLPDKSTPIVLFCRSGRRAQIAKEVLLEKGYQKVRNLKTLEAAAEKLSKVIVESKSQPEACS